MVLFLVVILYLSIIGMVALIYIKRWEIKTGKVFAVRARPTVMGFVHVTVSWSKDTLPSKARSVLHRAGLELHDITRHALASAILWTEHTLEQVLNTIRQKTLPPPSNIKASEFLREVAEHKKTLAKHSRHRNVIVDD